MLPKPYEDYERFTGPYVSVRERYRMVIHLCTENGKPKRIYYSRYLMEVELGRFLSRDEIVHHKDGNTFNNDLGNLEVMSKCRHDSLHSPMLIETFVCPACNKEFAMSGNKLSYAKYNRKIGRANSGPYCSRSCGSRR